MERDFLGNAIEHLWKIMKFKLHSELFKIGEVEKKLKFESFAEIVTCICRCPGMIMLINQS